MELSGILIGLKTQDTIHIYKYFMSFIRNKIYPSKILWNIFEHNILNDICVPCYHVVNDTQQPHIKNLYPIVSIKKFEKDLDFLAKKFEFISPNELLDYIDKEEIPKNKCILSFDDGYIECYDIIFPILKRKGIPAIFFIIKDLVENNNLAHFNKISLVLSAITESNSKKVIDVLCGRKLYSGDVTADIRSIGLEDDYLLNEIALKIDINFNHFLKENKPYLNRIHIKEMHRNGFGIGAHSVNHQKFIKLDIDHQRAQIIQSIDYIESLLCEPTRFFAFPYSSEGFNSDLYKEFPNLVFFDTHRKFQKSNATIIQRFIMDSEEEINGRLIEIKLKKLSYLIRNKKIPVISKIQK